jgi:23S rRNA (pseudouridine1915-N3)-methyltransferase
MIRIICVGKLTQKQLFPLIEYYQKQIPMQIDWLEVNDEASEKQMHIEAERILKNIDQNDYVIALAIEGKMYDSVSFSKMMDAHFSYNQKRLVFVIGGSYGLSEEVLERANMKISFSKMTFPHQLMRLILIEQIYRAFMIQKNHPYHK